MDAARQKTFEKINRPNKKLKITDIIQGLRQFRKQFKGRIWLEIMLVKEVNDSKKDLRALKEAVSSINPDKIQLNTVAREPAEKWAGPLTYLELKKAQKFFGKKCRLISGKKDKRKRLLKDLK